MAKMYSYDDVMELLEVQRKSIMEFEAAKNKLILSGLIEKSDIDEVHVTLDALEKWTPESIHEAVLKIKTQADVGNPSIWRDWVLTTLGGPKKVKHWNTPNLVHLKPLNK